MDKPSTDPVVIWMNGGPGCSSLIGLFSENGPFVFDDGETVIKPNPYSWNARANTLYIEQPACVGFSKASTANDGKNDDFKYNDMSSSKDLFAALQQFYKLYPELKANDLWITGESYAGVYGPYLAYQIHSYNQK